MEQIKLSKSEKEALRIVERLGGKRHSTYPAHVFNASVISLQGKGLVRAKFLTNGDVWTARLSEEGKRYISINPYLRNPIDWKIIGTITAALSLIVSIIALFVSCASIH